MIDITVVGAGPAGLQAAAAAGSALGTPPAGSIQILEAMPSPGKKLLISGSGQCNITHTGAAVDFLDRYGEAGRFLRPALYTLPPEKLLDQFREAGMEFETEESGKIFPRSRSAREVLELLLKRAKRLGVDLRYGERIQSIETTPFGFRLSSIEKAYETRRLILACGGASYPSTGSDGSGFRLARELGHSIAEPRPGLTDLLIEPFPLSSLAGISISGARLLAKRNGKVVAALRGDLLISHRGFSGPVILDASRSLRPGDHLIPDFTGLGEHAERELIGWQERYGKRSLLRAAEIFAAPEKLFLHLLTEGGIDPHTRSAELSKTVRRAVIEALAGREYPIARLGGFKRAMVTVGGVSRSEINPKTMESRIVPGLYFAGEIIDIDGDTGGYNLQAAFSTGELAGGSAALTPRR